MTRSPASSSARPARARNAGKEPLPIPYNPYACRGTGSPQRCRCRGRARRRDAARADRFPQLSRGEAHPRHRAGGADRAQWRRQDQSAGGRVLSRARARAARRQARRNRSPVRPRRMPRGRRLGCRRGRRDAPRPLAHRHRPRCRGGRAAGRAHRRRAGARPGGAGRAARRRVADPADGSPVSRGPGRTPAVSRSARARPRPGHGSRVAAYEQALRERSRLLRDGPADPAWLDRARGGHGRTGRRGRGRPARGRAAARPRLRRGRRARFRAPG